MDKINIFGVEYDCHKLHYDVYTIVLDGKNVYLSNIMQYVEVGDDINGLIVKDYAIYRSHDRYLLGVMLQNPDTLNESSHGDAIFDEEYIRIKKIKYLLK